MLKKCKKRSWARILTILCVGGLLFTASAIAAGVMQGGNRGSPVQAAADKAGGNGTVKAVFGPETFTRTEGKPDEFNRSFVATPGNYTLSIKNDGVTSAWVQMNGRQVAGPDAFKKNTTTMRFEISLKERNMLFVKLASKPGSSITILIAKTENKKCPEVQALVLKIRWGYFDEKERHDSDAMVPWDGFIQTTGCGMKVMRLLRFDQGGNYSNGGDDRLVRGAAPNVVQWKSSTTTNWDGIVVAMRLPERKEANDTYVTIYLTQWTKVYKISELVNINTTIPIDRLGHAIEIQGKVCKIPAKEPAPPYKDRPMPPPDDGKTNRTCPPNPEPPLPPRK